MTDEEYKQLLTALAAKHVAPRRIPNIEERERLHNAMKSLTRLSRQVQDIREEPTDRKQPDPSGPYKDLVYSLEETPLSHGFEAMDYMGILDALDDAPDAVFANLRRSAIPNEDVEFLYRAGIPNPELEITITIEFAKKNIGSSPRGIARQLRDIREVQHEMAARLDKVLSVSAKDREAAPKKRKILNGIGKILGGAIAGTGNVLLLCGTIIAPNPATGAGAIASAGIAIAQVLQGAGDLRGE